MSNSGSLDSSSSAWPAQSVTGAAGGAPTAGVASLDSSLVQQTKSEIRTLAAEIAELAHSGVAVDEFFDGFLPRICVAMGASASAVWSLKDRHLELDASHQLPDVLHEQDEEGGSRRPSESHLAILNCAIADGQPVLVPPKSVTVEVDRPTNPLQESLVIVPVRVEDEIEYVVEIVQKSSGGPAAQRGYLRFVAQMADLLADYFRRQRLREFTEQAEALDLLESCLLEIAEQETFASRAQVAAGCLNDLVEAELTVLVESRGRRAQCLAISSGGTADPRSEISLLVADLTRKALANTAGCSFPLWLQATERRQSVQDQPADRSSCSDAFQSQLDRLCNLLHCRSAVALSLDETDSTLAWIFFSAGSNQAADAGGREAVVRFGNSIGGLLTAARPVATFWNSWLPFRSKVGRQATRTQQIQKWVTRVALSCLVGVLAVFPLPQQISATGTLIPVQKIPYYAPHDGVVREVHIAEGDSVQQGQVLLQLVSHKLSTQLDALNGELRLNKDRRTQLIDLLNRGTELRQIERDQLEGELQLLQIQQQTKQQELQVIHKQLQEMRIEAIGNGVVSTWDLSNRLLNRPVIAGDLLVTTYVPEGSWKLQLSIPDYRAGIVASRLAELDNGKQGVPVRFSLSSHPDQLQEAALIHLGSRTIRSRSDASSPDNGSVVIGEAMLDVEKLPLAKDGAIARATIDCGKVPAIWLMVRDAYWAISSRIQMIW